MRSVNSYASTAYMQYLHPIEINALARASEEISQLQREKQQLQLQLAKNQLQDQLRNLQVSRPIVDTFHRKIHVKSQPKYHHVHSNSEPISTDIGKQMSKLRYDVQSLQTAANSIKKESRRQSPKGANQFNAWSSDCSSNFSGDENYYEQQMQLPSSINRNTTPIGSSSNSVSLIEAITLIEAISSNPHAQTALCAHFGSKETFHNILGNLIENKQCLQPMIKVLSQILQSNKSPPQPTRHQPSSSWSRPPQSQLHCEILQQRSMSGHSQQSGGYYSSSSSSSSSLLRSPPPIHQSSSASEMLRLIHRRDASRISSYENDISILESELDKLKAKVARVFRQSTPTNNTHLLRCNNNPTSTTQSFPYQLSHQGASNHNHTLNQLPSSFATTEHPFLQQERRNQQSQHTSPLCGTTVPLDTLHNQLLPLSQIYLQQQHQLSNLSQLLQRESPESFDGCVMQQALPPPLFQVMSPPLSPLEQTVLCADGQLKQGSEQQLLLASDSPFPCDSLKAGGVIDSYASHDQTCCRAKHLTPSIFARTALQSSSVKQAEGQPSSPLLHSVQPTSLSQPLSPRKDSDSQQQISPLPSSDKILLIDTLLNDSTHADPTLRRPPPSIDLQSHEVDYQITETNEQQTSPNTAGLYSSMLNEGGKHVSSSIGQSPMKRIGTKPIQADYMKSTKSRDNYQKDIQNDIIRRWKTGCTPHSSGTPSSSKNSTRNSSNSRWETVIGLLTGDSAAITHQKDTLPQKKITNDSFNQKKESNNSSGFTRANSFNKPVALTGPSPPTDSQAPPSPPANLNLNQLPSQTTLDNRQAPCSSPSQPLTAKFSLATGNLPEEEEEQLQAELKDFTRILQERKEERKKSSSSVNRVDSPPPPSSPPPPHAIENKSYSDILLPPLPTEDNLDEEEANINRLISQLDSSVQSGWGKLKSRLLPSINRPTTPNPLQTSPASPQLTQLPKEEKKKKSYIGIKEKHKDTTAVKQDLPLSKLIQHTKVPNVSSSSKKNLNNQVAVGTAVSPPKTSLLGPK